MRNPETGGAAQPTPPADGAVPPPRSEALEAELAALAAMLPPEPAAPEAAPDVMAGEGAAEVP